jgi:hypothetical protein
MHSQVLPRLLSNFLATGDVDWVVKLLKAAHPSTSCEFGSFDQEGNAEVSVFYKQVTFLNAT